MASWDRPPADKSYTHISGGERQLVLIACTLCQEPEIILRTNPLPIWIKPGMVLQTIRSLSRRGMTIMLTSHFPTMSGKIGNMGSHAGKPTLVAQGPVDEVMTEKNLSETYGVAVKIYSAAATEGGFIRYCEPDL